MVSRRRFACTVVFLLLSFMVTGFVRADETEGLERTGLRPDAPEFAIRGPYPVGVMEMTIDMNMAYEMPVMMWYPAQNLDNEQEQITYMVGPNAAFRQYVDSDVPLPIAGRALLDAKPDFATAPYPLVVLSHSYTASKEFSYVTGEHLAPDHQWDSWESLYAGNIKRMREIKPVIDHAEAITAPNGELTGLIDMDFVAITGWSSGATINYGIAGAQIDWDSIQEYCVDYADTPACFELENQKALILESAGLDAAPDGLWSPMADDRIDAIVPMAGTVEMFGQQGLAMVEVPLLALFGTTDADAPWMSPGYDYVSSEYKVEVVFHGADHFIFDVDCAVAPWLVDDMGAFGWCSDPVWDMKRAQDLTNHFITAFLKDLYANDETAHEALMPDNVNFPGITYRASMP